jgi:secondary thiamine-phosphate synthase enzyme
VKTATEYLWFSTKKHREYLNDHYRHHRTGETNGDSHLKSLLVHHEVVVPITGGRLDLGPWQQVYYAEFDGRRRKRVVFKVMGEERRASG